MLQKFGFVCNDGGAPGIRLGEGGGREMDKRGMYQSE